METKTIERDANNLIRGKIGALVEMTSWVRSKFS